MGSIIRAIFLGVVLHGFALRGRLIPFARDVLMRGVVTVMLHICNRKASENTKLI
jgi:hypothetical protein